MCLPITGRMCVFGTTVSGAPSTCERFLLTKKRSYVKLYSRLFKRAAYSRMRQSRDSALLSVMRAFPSPHSAPTHRNNKEQIGTLMEKSLNSCVPQSKKRFPTGTFLQVPLHPSTYR